jgi:hypothetical protein
MTILRFAAIVVLVAAAVSLPIILITLAMVSL